MPETTKKRKCSSCGDTVYLLAEFTGDIGKTDYLCDDCDEEKVEK